jgi:hypothetical protein
MHAENDLNLHSESEDDADEEDDGDEDDSGEQEEQPFMTRTMDIYKTFTQTPSTAESSLAGKLFLFCHLVPIN